LKRWLAEIRYGRKDDITVVVSKEVAKHFKKYLPFRKTLTIDNGVQLNKPFLDRSKQNNRPLKIICVGRLSFEKGHDLLIDTLSKVSFPFELTFLGDGDQRKNLEKKVFKKIKQNTQKVFFKGNKSDIKHYLNTHHLFILPSRSEGLSLALLEALSSAIPVIASNVGQNKEAVSNFGHIYDTLGELLQLLNEANDNYSNFLIKNPEMLKKHLSRYSLQNMTDQYENAYKNLLNN
jgi:glycosyltransferase involved in cell wall biosynthesis